MDFDFKKFTIKQEKQSPPRCLGEDTTCGNLSLKQERELEDSKKVAPLKSSNEILAELFEVFNAKPPEILLNDNRLLEKNAPKQIEISNVDDVDLKERKIKRTKRLKKHSKSSLLKRKPDSSLRNKTKQKDSGKGESNILSEHMPVNKTEYVATGTINEIVKNENPVGDPRTISKERENEVVSSDLSLSDEEVYKHEKEASCSTRNSRHFNRNRESIRRNKEEYIRSSKYMRKDIRSRSRSRSPHKKRCNAEPRSRRPHELVIDKKKLLQIARKNAVSMFKNGSLPGTQTIPEDVKNNVLLEMRYGGKSLEEITEFCKKLSNKEKYEDLSSISSNDDSDYDKHGNDKAFYHPFLIKDRGPIIMNIKNATPINPKRADQIKTMLLQFPVSSGQQHKLNENQWVPVSPTKQDKSESIPCTSMCVIKKNLPHMSTAKNEKNMFEELAVNSQASVCMKTNPASSSQEIADVSRISDQKVTSAVANTYTVKSPVNVKSEISKRLNAMRKLQDNPTDPEALKVIWNARKDMSEWSSSLSTPADFTGSSGPNTLCGREVTSKQHAWATKDQLISSAPVSGGMGMHLLQKMGWKPGEGLGKFRNGSLQPLLLEVKFDKKGLLAREEGAVSTQIRNRKKRSMTLAEAKINIENKHPVNLLGELSAKKKWGPPSYELVDEGGPPHRKSFTYKVVVDGMMYQPAVTSNTKKDAKALAAKYCLQQLGILDTGKV